MNARILPEDSLYEGCDNPPVLVMENIVKKFGSHTANDGINLTVHKGEIHAVLGENGAGKTTLMNILSGFLKPDSGRILIRGREVDITDSRAAARLGIGMVHQHFKLIGRFTVTENVILGREPVKHGMLDTALAVKKVAEMTESLGMRIDPEAVVDELPVGLQQGVEILKVIYRGGDILIFDEPTAVLTPGEVLEFISILKNLAEAGKSIILITHKLREIKLCCDVCTVIRQGKNVGTVRVSEVTEDEMARLMVGRRVSLNVSKNVSECTENVLELRDLYYEAHGSLASLRGLNLTVRRGEIVGMAGIAGNGQEELVDIVMGLVRPSSGSVKILGKDISGLETRKILEAGVSCIPADRQKHGLITDLSIEDNFVLQDFDRPPFSVKGFLQRKNIRKHANKLIEDYDIRFGGTVAELSGNLSGGNQQKIIIAREISKDRELLVAFCPTRGLDVGAIEFVHEILLRQRDAGKAVLLISYDLDEIMKLADRVVVIFNGRINYSVVLNTDKASCEGAFLAENRRGHGGEEHLSEMAEAEHKIGIHMAGGVSHD